VGIDRTFCGRFLDAWAADESAGSALHAIDVIGMGDSTPKPKMYRRLMGGWEAPPRTPREWAEQVVAYVDEEIGEAAVIMGQSNLCTVALEAAALRPSSVCGVILLGPPAVEALSLDKPDESIAKIWRIVGSPIGAALYRFARRKAFLGSFSKKNLFAKPDQVDDTYLDVCAAGAADADTRHAVFSFVAGTWRQDYRPLLAALTTPTLILSGRDVGPAASTGGGVGNAEAAPTAEASDGGSRVQASDVDKTSFGNLLRWFAVWRKGRDQKAGTFDQVARDLGVDPEAKLRDFVKAMPAAQAASSIETALLPGWNVLVYESPEPLAQSVSGFVSRRFANVEGAATPPSSQGELSLLLPVSPIKIRIWDLAQRLVGGGRSQSPEAEADVDAMEDLVRQLEARNPTPDAATSPLLDGEWDQVYCTNPGGSPVVWSDGRSSRRQLAGPLCGRVTQIIDSQAGVQGTGSYKQRVQSRLLSIRAELSATIRPQGADSSAVEFRRFAVRAAGLRLRDRSAEGYVGEWTHTYLDSNTRVMRTRREGGGGGGEGGGGEDRKGEFLFVLRRRVS